uniref:Uncharacterized protein n=1 Tax=Globisporangium ultimum (strain ATCC 200006 / CBS 805.95 / DAOM BR144) TaxID=431595 RepID=K3WQK8_GLOUD
MVAIVMPVAVARGFAVACIVLWLPTVVTSTAVLQYDVVLVLVRAYDFWFYSFMNAQTFFVLGVLLGDVRALAPLAAWAGVQINIVIDASIRGVRLWTILNVAGVVNCALMWFVVSFDIFLGLDVVELLPNSTTKKLHGPVVPVTAFVASGLLTVTAIVAPSSVGVFVDVYLLSNATTDHLPVCQLLALALALVYCATFLLHSQHHLLHALVTSFEFLFYAVQINVVNFGAWNFFFRGKTQQSRNWCIFVSLSWLWIHWVMFLDAVPPVMRRRLDLRAWFPLAVVLLVLSFSATLIYFLLTADSNAAKIDIDRMLWEGVVMGKVVHFHFRLLPLFYN